MSSRSSARGGLFPPFIVCRGLPGGSISGTTISRSTGIWVSAGGAVSVFMARRSADRSRMSARLAVREPSRLAMMFLVQ
jgi:hypothetical protein